MFHSIQIQRDTFQKKKKNIQQPFFTILLQNPTKERFEVIPNNRDRWFLPYFTRISSSFGVTFTSAWRTVVSGDDKQPMDKSSRYTLVAEIRDSVIYM